MMMPLDLGIFGARGLPVPTDYLNVNLFTGNGGSSRSLSSVNLAAGGAAWIKSRSAGQDPLLCMSANGSTRYEGNPNSTLVLGSPTVTMDASGFNLTDAVQNVSARTYCGYGFRKQARFLDVVTWTGDGASSKTIAHALGVEPGMIIVRERDTNGNTWVVYLKGPGIGFRYSLTGATGRAANAVLWPTLPTDTNFYVGANGSFLENNANGRNYVALVFAHDPAADSVIRAGSYIGNGTSLGPEVHHGFQPRWLLIKGQGSTNFQVYDTSRGLGVGNERRLFVGANAAEGVIDEYALLSDGFQSNNVNSNTNTFEFAYLAIK